jgi:hypothetical protein
MIFLYSIVRTSYRSHLIVIDITKVINKASSNSSNMDDGKGDLRGRRSPLAVADSYSLSPVFYVNKYATRIGYEENSIHRDTTYSRLVLHASLAWR